MSAKNMVIAGDYSGFITFKGDKKGLLITENKFFGAKKTFINKTAVDHYELVMQEVQKPYASWITQCINPLLLFYIDKSARQQH